MRDYNYRKNVRQKEKRRLKELYNNRGYRPAMPNKKIDKDGQVYYVEGYQCHRKKYIKKAANKAVRKSKISNINKGSHYKKIYELLWEWY